VRGCEDGLAITSSNLPESWISFDPLLIPSSGQMCRGCGICRTASIRQRALVSTTWLLIRFPLGVMTPSVQLDAWASSPIYLSMGILLLGWVLPGSLIPECPPLQEVANSLSGPDSASLLLPSRTRCPYDAHPSEGAGLRERRVIALAVIPVNRVPTLFLGTDLPAPSSPEASRNFLTATPPGR